MKALLIALIVIAILVFVVLRLFGRKWAGTAEKQSAEAPPVGQASAEATASDKDSLTAPFDFSQGRLLTPCPPVSDVTGISITLKVDGDPFLFILVAGDGTTNRMGSGTFEDKNRELFIGRTEPAIFEAVRSHVTPELLRISGGFEHKDRRGTTCELTIGFKFKDGGESGFGFRYGSESEGPPQQVRDFVTEAVRVTEPWYQDFKQRTQKNRQEPS